MTSNTGSIPARKFNESDAFSAITVGGYSGKPTTGHVRVPGRTQVVKVGSSSGSRSRRTPYVRLSTIELVYNTIAPSSRKPVEFATSRR